MVADLLDQPLVGFDADAVDAAVGQVRDHVGWHIAPSATETVTLDGPGSDTLLLPSLLVTAVASVAENGMLLDPSTYDWSANGVVERIRGRWTGRRRGLVVSFTHGYTECPPAVRAVVQRLAVDPALIGVRSESQTKGPYARSRTFEPGARSGAIDEYTERILARYKLPARS